jgi:hypothetical protein
MILYQSAVVVYILQYITNTTVVVILHTVNFLQSHK